MNDDFIRNDGDTGNPPVTGKIVQLTNPKVTVYSDLPVNTKEDHGLLDEPIRYILIQTNANPHRVLEEGEITTKEENRNHWTWNVHGDITLIRDEKVFYITNVKYGYHIGEEGTIAGLQIYFVENVTDSSEFRRFL